MAANASVKAKQKNFLIAITFPNVKLISHCRDIASDSIVVKRNQDFRPLVDGLDFVQIPLCAHCPFNERDINAFGELLGVH
jgi:hypothetical protein